MMGFAVLLLIGPPPTYYGPGQGDLPDANTSSFFASLQSLLGTGWWAAVNGAVMPEIDWGMWSPQAREVYKPPTPYVTLSQLKVGAKVATIEIWVPAAWIEVTTEYKIHLLNIDLCDILGRPNLVGLPTNPYCLQTTTPTPGDIGALNDEGMNEFYWVNVINLWPEKNVRDFVLRPVLWLGGKIVEQAMNEFFEPMCSEVADAVGQGLTGGVVCDCLTDAYGEVSRMETAVWPNGWVYKDTDDDWIADNSGNRNFIHLGFFSASPFMGLDVLAGYILNTLRSVNPDWNTDSSNFVNFWTHNIGIRNPTQMLMIQDPMSSSAMWHYYLLHQSPQVLSRLGAPTVGSSTLYAIIASTLSSGVGFPVDLAALACANWMAYHPGDVFRVPPFLNVPVGGMVLDNQRFQSLLDWFNQNRDAVLQQVSGFLSGLPGISDAREAFWDILNNVHVGCWGPIVPWNGNVHDGHVMLSHLKTGLRGMYAWFTLSFPPKTSNMPGDSVYTRWLGAWRVFARDVRNGFYKIQLTKPDELGNVRITPGEPLWNYDMDALVTVVDPQGNPMNKIAPTWQGYILWKKYVVDVDLILRFNEDVVRNPGDLLGCGMRSIIEQKFKGWVDNICPYCVPGNPGG